MAINTFGELVTQVNNMLANFATTVGNDIISENRSSTALFDKGSGYYVNSHIAPITSLPIALDITGAVNGGFCGVYYKGPVINAITNFSGATKIFLSGVNVLDELCIVWITYHKTLGVFLINIQTGTLLTSIGSTVPDAPTALALVEGTTTTPPPDAPTAIILTEGTI